MNVSMIVTNTPIWVWLVLAWGIWNGFINFKSRQNRIWLVWIVPVVFTFLSVQSLMSAAAHQSIYVLLWCIAVLVGIAIGSTLLSARPSEIDRSKGVITLNGSIIPLIIFIFVFGCKYVFGVGLAINPGLIESVSFTGTILALSGLSTGVMTGRVALWYHIWFKQADRLST